MRPSLSLRPAIVSAVAVVALVSGPLVFAPAQAAGGSVTGTVVDSTGSPVADAYIAVWVKDEDEGVYVPDDYEGETDEQGHYELDLEPGTYRFGVFADERYESEYYNDATRLKNATSVVVGTSAVSLDTVELELLPTVEGSIRTTSGKAVPYGYAVAVTGDEENGYSGESFAEVEADGTYSMPVPAGTYVIGFFDDEDDYEGEFWNDAQEIEDATPVTVDADGVTGIDAVLTAVPTPIRGTVQNIERPTVQEYAAIGKPMTAADGRWSPGAALTRQWLRNGTPIPGATGATYQVKPADRGASLSVRVTGATPGYLPSTVTSNASGVVRWPGRLVATSTSGRKKAVVSLRVVSGGPTPTGVVRVRMGRKVVRTVKLRNGRARFTIKKQPRTLVRYDVQFSGDAATHAVRGGVKVTLKKAKKKR